MKNIYLSNIMNKFLLKKKSHENQLLKLVILLSFATATVEMCFLGMGPVKPHLDLVDCCLIFLFYFLSKGASGWHSLKLRPGQRLPRESRAVNARRVDVERCHRNSSPHRPKSRFLLFKQKLTAGSLSRLFF
jgi:hypothetical protein